MQKWQLWERKDYFCCGYNYAIAVGIYFIIFIFSCSSYDLGEYNTIQYGEDLIDNRDSINPQIYKTVIIGSQTWMAENLKYNANGSKCYGEGHTTELGITDFDVQTYCQTYGKLYTWEAAISVCPGGWHLPDSAEWQKLIDFVENRKKGTAGIRLKATSGWLDTNGNKYGNGTDNYGFSALPGGYGYPAVGFSRSFVYLGNYGCWWNATNGPYKEDYHHFSYMFSSLNHIHISYDDKSYFFSVRCIKD